MCDLGFLRGFPVSFLTYFVILVNNSLDFLLGSNTFPNQFLAVDVQNIGMFLQMRYFLPYRAMVERLTLIMEYMIGWVNIGSSISLCPNFLYPTKSITTSLCQVALHSAAILETSITGSGSTAFTWNIGALTTRPTSVQ